MMNVILIDPELKAIEQIEISGSLDSMYEVMGTNVMEEGEFLGAYRRPNRQDADIMLARTRATRWGAKPAEIERVIAEIWGANAKAFPVPTNK